MQQTAKALALIAIGMAAAAGALGTERSTAAAFHAPAVLELFTSEGCSSCPPADALLGRLARRKDVIALSYNVDYWDYLGWHDTLASPANSARQKAYATTRGDGQVYTPQIVVNGLRHAVGSDAAAIESAIGATEARLAQSEVPVHIARGGGALTIDVAAAPAGSAVRVATLYLARATNEVRVPVGRGENGGRTIAYHHVVRSLAPVGRWHGAAMSLRLPLAAPGQAGADLFVALLQAPGPGAILGAAETPAR